MLLLQPIDELFDAVLQGPKRNRVLTESNQPLPSNDIDSLYTRDYMQGPKNTKDTSRWPVQGGLLVMKPSLTKFQSILDVVLAGNFNKSGWGESQIGVFWGGAQIQGLLSYVYLNDPSAVELDRCVYNNMADDQVFRRGPYKGRCITLKPNCSHCELTPFDEIKLVHLTVCSKPWNCVRYKNRSGQCDRMLGKWFEIRRQLEADWGRPFQPPPLHRWFNNVSLGYCKSSSILVERYLPLNPPEGLNWSSLRSLAPG